MKTIRIEFTEPYLNVGRKVYRATTEDQVGLEKELKELGIKYDRRGEFIEITSSEFRDFVEAVNLLSYEVLGEDKSSVTRIKKIFEEIPEKLNKREDIYLPKFKMEPYRRQKEVILYGMEKERFLLADQMGSGKTFSAILLAEYLKGYYDFDKVLIINGVYNVQFSWESEVEQFSNSTSIVLGKRKRRDGTTRGGSTKEKLDDLKAVSDETYIITNIESLRNEDILNELQSLINNGTIGMVVVDEIHYCIGRTSKQGKALQTLRPKFRLGMSGTPFNDPLDMYAIEKWLGTTYKGIEEYKLEYGIEAITDKSRAIAKRNRRRPFPEYIFNQHQKFADDISRFMLRRDDYTKDLPPIIFKDYLVEMGKEQREIYEQVFKEESLGLSTTSLEDIEETRASQMYYEARRAMTNPHLYGINQDVKLEAVITLLTEIIASGKTAIVFGYFIETMFNYERVLSEKFPGKGNYVTDDTQDVWGVVMDNFQAGNGSFLVAGAKKIGTGFNITRADYVIFADRPPTWNDYQQAYMRAWRNGRKEPVHVIKILCLDTWDDKISFNLQERKSTTDLILGENTQVRNAVEDIDK